jgi:NADH:ubiquinone oxidoreductase subunit E
MLARCQAACGNAPAQSILGQLVGQDSPDQVVEESPVSRELSRPVKD